ncbi:MAG: hypothetical protein DMF93_00395 [Acidobacteria bacterium]|nr:MAG: hypothetical protein DMF93_00395 [Acidobacteriota bacterium]
MTLAVRRAALTIVAVLPIISAAVRAQDAARQPEAGEKILTAACQSCHDSRHVDTQALDEEGWTKVVKGEIARGAEVKSDDVPVLVDYLARYHGPLPEGPGKDVVLNICTQCHDLQRVRRRESNHRAHGARGDLFPRDLRPTLSRRRSSDLRRDATHRKRNPRSFESRISRSIVSIAAMTDGSWITPFG